MTEPQSQPQPEPTQPPMPPPVILTASVLEGPQLFYTDGLMVIPLSQFNSDALAACLTDRAIAIVHALLRHAAEQLGDVAHTRHTGKDRG
jgi:hypothetical protein